MNTPTITKAIHRFLIFMIVYLILEEFPPWRDAAQAMQWTLLAISMAHRGGRVKQKLLDSAFAFIPVTRRGQNAALETLVRDDGAGTGFGETTWSPAYKVPFEPESAAAGRVVLKYGWRSEPCRTRNFQVTPGDVIQIDRSFFP